MPKGPPRLLGQTMAPGDTIFFFFLRHSPFVPGNLTARDIVRLESIQSALSSPAALAGSGATTGVNRKSLRQLQSDTRQAEPELDQANLGEEMGRGVSFSKNGWWETRRQTKKKEKEIVDDVSDSNGEAAMKFHRSLQENSETTQKLCGRPPPPQPPHPHL